MNQKATPLMKMFIFILAVFLLVAFNNNDVLSAGRFAPKTKTPTPTRTPTKTPTPTRTPTPTITNTPAPTGTPFGCSSWNLATDFRILPNQENPNRDSCNNLGVWGFMGSGSLTRDPANYYLYSIFGNGGIPGLNIWSGNYLDSNGRFPHIGFNASGATFIQGAITWPANTVDVHPAPSQLVIMAWRSPVTGYVSVTGGVSDNNPACGDGVLWYIDKNSTTVASGGYVNGGSQTFANGVGGTGLNTVAVSAGDVIYLAIHPGGNYLCDDSRVDLFINVTSPPTATSTPIATATFTPTKTPTSTATFTPTITTTPNRTGVGTCWNSGASWPDYNTNYSIESSIPTVWIPWIESSAMTWTNITPSHFSLSRLQGSPNFIAKGTVNKPVEWIAITNVIASSTTPITLVTTKFDETDDPNFPPASNNYNIENVMTHEFGHWLQLEDIADANCTEVTMYEYIPLNGEIKKITLEQADINGANYQYP